MNTYLLAIFLLMSVSVARAQEVLNMPKNFLPNALDSNNFYYTADVSYFVDYGETTEVQKSMVPKTKGNRILKGKLEMVFFPSMKYTHRFEPHFFVRAEAMPVYYLASKLGVGVSDRKLNSSVGFFTGSYYRRVAHDGNFVTRRARRFEAYPINGFYLQTSRRDVRAFFSLGFEKRRVFYNARFSGRFGETLCFGEESSLFRSLEMVFSYESLVGFGFGFSGEVIPGVRLDVLTISPHHDDQLEQAEVNNKLSRGVLVTLGFYVK